MNTVVSKLKEASEAYYNAKSDSSLTDAEYDVLVEQLREQDPNNEFLQTVGAPPNSDRANVKHSIPMGSLEKIKRTELGAWMKKMELGSD